MLAGYETEQTDLKVKIEELESLVTDATQQTANIESFSLAWYALTRRLLSSPFKLSTHL